MYKIKRFSISKNKKLALGLAGVGASSIIASKFMDKKKK